MAFVVTNPNTPTLNTIQPASDADAGLIITAHSPSQSAALFRVKVGNDTILGVGGAFGSGTSVLDSQAFFVAAPPASTAPILAEFIAQSGLDSVWVENTGIGPTRSSMACFSNDNGDAALRAFSNGGGQTAPIFQVVHTGTPVIEVGPATFAAFGKPPAPQQVGGAAVATAVYTATEQLMLQKAYNCLRTFGFLS